MYLMTFFANIGPNIADSLPSETDSFISMLPGNYPESFFFTDITTTQVKDIISNLKDKSCPHNFLIFFILIMIVTTIKSIYKQSTC